MAKKDKADEKRKAGDGVDPLTGAPIVPAGDGGSTGDEAANMAGEDTPVRTGDDAIARVKRGADRADAIEEGSLDEAAIASDDETYFAELRRTLPPSERGKPGADLFAEACVAYGINPDPAVQPRELLHADTQDRFKFYAANRAEGVPNHVAFVTAGGVKVVHPRGDYTAGLDFERRLRKIFKTQRPDGREADLPDNLTLPRTQVDGVVPKNGPHIPAVGFMRRRAQAAARGR